MKCNRIGCLQVSEYKGFCAHHAKVMNMKSKSDMPKSESKKNKGGGKGGGGVPLPIRHQALANHAQ